MINIFYGQGPGSFFVHRTDLADKSKAEEFLNSYLFIDRGYTFYFMLQDGKKLIKGNPIQNNEKYFSDSMKFALLVPYEDTLIN